MNQKFCFVPFNSNFNYDKSSLKVLVFYFRKFYVLTLYVNIKDQQYSVNYKQMIIFKLTLLKQFYFDALNVE